MLTDEMKFVKQKFIFFSHPTNAIPTATTIAGSRFATLIFLPHTRLTPTQKIKIEPTKDRFAKAASVITGLITLASTVTLPCKIATGIAENAQPFFAYCDLNGERR